MAKIIYPEFVNSSLTLGVTAPSSGLGHEAFKIRFDIVMKQQIAKGIKIIPGECLMENIQFVSGSSLQRAKEFLKMWRDKNIFLIQPPWGGEHLIDILEHIEFDSLIETPTWLQGYSDISTLLFAITTKTGIATVHGSNFMDLISGQDQLTEESRNYLYLKKGETFTQKSSEMWQKEFIGFHNDVYSKFHLSEKTEWKILNSELNEFKVEGRIIGGCLDVISELCGTPYGDLVSFKQKYCKNEGTIFYFENCEQNPIQLYRILIKLKYSGWFDKLNALIIGRNSGPENDDFTYLDCLKKVFKNMTYPIIYDADIGHKPPQMTLVNGAVMTLFLNSGKAVVKQEFC